MNVPHTRAQIAVNTPEHMGDLGRALAALLRPGDLVLLTGELGAGKTTLTRGLGAGLGVRGDVTSPTFVIARVHPSLGAGPPLVHVDAYRLGGGLDEMEDLDLDVSLPESVVVVEWGDGKVEELSDDRLHVVIERAVGAEEELSAPQPGAGAAGAAEVVDEAEVAGAAEVAGGVAGGADGVGVDAGPLVVGEGVDVRRVTVTGVGARWAGVDLTPLMVVERAG